MIEYKGYTASIELNVEENMIRGRVEGIYDIVTFEGRTVQEAVADFRGAVDDYLELCTSMGKVADMPRKAAA